MARMNFVLENRHFLSFGSLYAALTTFGSLYFVGLFNPAVQAEFGLSHGELGAIYSLSVVLSFPFLIWLGRLIDEVDLRLYAVGVSAAFVAGCYLMAWAPIVVAFAAAVYLVRLTGDWLMDHTALTSTARVFGANRGKALAVVAVGAALGQAILPFGAVALMALVGWRATWAIIGTAFVAIVIPLTLWLLKGGAGRPDYRSASEPDPIHGERVAEPRWTRRAVLTDVRFHLFLPVAIIAPFVMSGFLFHEVHIANAKGWSVTWLAASIAGYSLGNVVSSVASGPLIDRFGARRLLPYHPLPLAGGLLILALFNHPAVAILYLVGTGSSIGLWHTMTSALWAELYGVRDLGRIRSLFLAITVLSVAVATAGMGWLIDLGVGVEQLAAAAVAVIGITAALALAPAVRSGGAPAKG